MRRGRRRMNCLLGIEVGWDQWMWLLGISAWDQCLEMRRRHFSEDQWVCCLGLCLFLLRFVDQTFLEGGTPQPRCNGPDFLSR